MFYQPFHFSFSCSRGRVFKSVILQLAIQYKVTTASKTDNQCNYSHKNTFLLQKHMYILHFYRVLCFLYFHFNVHYGHKTIITLYLIILQTMSTHHGVWDKLTHWLIMIVLQNLHSCPVISLCDHSNPQWGTYITERTNRDWHKVTNTSIFLSNFLVMKLFLLLLSLFYRACSTQNSLYQK